MSKSKLPPPSWKGILKFSPISLTFSIHKVILNITKQDKLCISPKVLGKCLFESRTVPGSDKRQSIAFQVFDLLSRYRQTHRHIIGQDGDGDEPPTPSATPLLRWRKWSVPEFQSSTSFKVQRQRISKSKKVIEIMKRFWNSVKLNQSVLIPQTYYLFTFAIFHFLFLPQFEIRAESSEEPKRWFSGKEPETVVSFIDDLKQRFVVDSMGKSFITFDDFSRYLTMFGDLFCFHPFMKKKRENVDFHFRPGHAIMNFENVVKGYINFYEDLFHCLFFKMEKWLRKYYVNPNFHKRIISERREKQKKREERIRKRKLKMARRRIGLMKKQTSLSQPVLDIDSDEEELKDLEKLRRVHSGVKFGDVKRSSTFSTSLISAPSIPRTSISVTVSGPSAQKIFRKGVNRNGKRSFHSRTRSISDYSSDRQKKKNYALPLLPGSEKNGMTENNSNNRNSSKLETSKTCPYFLEDPDLPDIVRPKTSCGSICSPFSLSIDENKKSTLDEKKDQLTLSMSRYLEHTSVPWTRRNQFLSLNTKPKKEGSYALHTRSKSENSPKKKKIVPGKRNVLETIIVKNPGMRKSRKSLKNLIVKKKLKERDVEYLTDELKIDISKNFKRSQPSRNHTDQSVIVNPNVKMSNNWSIIKDPLVKRQESQNDLLETLNVAKHLKPKNLLFFDPSTSPSSKKNKKKKKKWKLLENNNNTTSSMLKSSTYPFKKKKKKRNKRKKSMPVPEEEGKIFNDRRSWYPDGKVRNIRNTKTYEKYLEEEQTKKMMMEKRSKLEIMKKRNKDEPDLENNKSLVKVEEETEHHEFPEESVMSEYWSIINTLNL